MHDDIVNATLTLQHRIDSSIAALDRRMDSVTSSLEKVMGMLGSMVGKQDPGPSQAAGSDDNQEPPFLPANQRLPVPFDTAPRGPFTKQEQRGSSASYLQNPNLQNPNLQIPEQRPYRDDYRRSPSPYDRSNTLPPSFGGTAVRWRPEDLGYFHGQKDDIHTWVDRIRELVALKGSPIVQANLSLSLRDEAENWYHHELTKQQRSQLLDPESGIEPWIAALTHRFEMDPVEILAKLNKQRYTRADAAAGKDPIEHLHSVMKLTRNRSTAESLYEAYMRIDSVWQLSLVAPTSSTTIEDFVKQLNAKKAAWHSEARRMDNTKDSYRSYGNNKLWDQSANRQPAGDPRNGNSNKW